jgi:hypothetical protein
MRNRRLRTIGGRQHLTLRPGRSLERSLFLSLSMKIGGSQGSVSNRIMIPPLFIPNHRQELHYIIPILSAILRELLLTSFLSHCLYSFYDFPYNDKCQLYDGFKVTKIKILFNVCDFTDAVYYVTVITFFSGNHIHARPNTHTRTSKHRYKHTHPNTHTHTHSSKHTHTHALIQTHTHTHISKTHISKHRDPNTHTYKASTQIMTWLRFLSHAFSRSLSVG